MNLLRYLTLFALAAVGCSDDVSTLGGHNLEVSFIQPYPLGCGDADIDIRPVDAEPDDSVNIEGCFDRPPMGEAGNVYTALMEIPVGMWTLTVSIKHGDCVGGEDFVISEDELVKLWIDLTCE